MKNRVKIPDVIQVTSGLVNGAKVFVTNDGNLKKIIEIMQIVIDDTL